jgi:amino acid transporter
VTSAEGPESGVHLRRVVTLPWLILYGLGSTVGAGIYVLTGVVAGRAGMHAPIAFGIASLLALCTALSFAELSSRFPRAGGALVYVHEGLGSRPLSVAVGVATASAGMVSAATVSRGFVGYLTELATLPTPLVLLVIVGSVGGLAAWGVRESVVAAGLVTLIEIAGLVAVLVFGTIHLVDSPPPHPAALIPSGFEPGMWKPILTSTVICFFAFLGFEDMVNVAEEVRDVRSVLPKAILWTLGLSTALYIAVTAISVLVVAPPELAEVDAPLSLVFERSGGSSTLLSLIALIAMLNGALVQIVMASRILFSLSRDGLLPSQLSFVHPRTRTPIVATALITSIVLLLAAALPLERLAAATASIALGAFVLVNVSLFVILRREALAHPPRPKSLPLWIPAIGAFASLGFLVAELTSPLT